MSKGRRRHRDTPGVERDPAERTDASSEKAGASIEPVDVDGVRTVAVITVLWAVAFVVLALRIDSLSAEGRNWWLWTCLAGVGLGLLGLEYTRKRRDAIEAAAAARAGDADADGDEDGDGEVEPAPVEPVDAHPVDVHPVVEGPREPPPAERSSPEAITRPIDTGPLPRHRPAPSWPEPPSNPPVEPPSTGPEPEPEPETSAHSPKPESPPQRDSASSAPAWFGELDDEEAPGTDEPAPTPTPPPVSPPRSAPPDLDDDEPLLDTTLGGGRRARRYDTTGEFDEIDDVTEGGGEQYRGRRARRSDSA